MRNINYETKNNIDKLILLLKKHNKTLVSYFDNNKLFYFNYVKNYEIVMRYINAIITVSETENFYPCFLLLRAAFELTIINKFLFDNPIVNEDFQNFCARKATRYQEFKQEQNTYNSDSASKHHYDYAKKVFDNNTKLCTLKNLARNAGMKDIYVKCYVSLNDFVHNNLLDLKITDDLLKDFYINQMNYLNRSLINIKDAIFNVLSSITNNETK